MPKIDGKYSRVAIPEDLKDEIEKLFEELKDHNVGLGYASLSEFTKDALRRLIEKIRETHLQKST